jgi:hypothetical protein
MEPCSFHLDPHISLRNVQPGFSFKDFLCCSQSGNHPEINLAKCGYIEFGPFSFMKNPLYKSKSFIFSGQNLAKIRQ